MRALLAALTTLSFALGLVFQTIPRSLMVKTFRSDLVFEGVIDWEVVANKI